MRDECNFKVNKNLYTKDVWEIIKDKSFTIGTPTYGGGVMDNICFSGKEQCQYRVLGTGTGKVFISAIRKENTETSIWKMLFNSKPDEISQDMEILRKELEEYINA